MKVAEIERYLLRAVAKNVPKTEHETAADYKAACLAYLRTQTTVRGYVSVFGIHIPYTVRVPLPVRMGAVAIVSALPADNILNFAAKLTAAAG